MEGIGGLPGAGAQMPVASSEGVVEESVKGPVVNRSEPKRLPEKRKDHYKISKVDSAKQKKLPGNGSSASIIPVGDWEKLFSEIPVFQCKAVKGMSGDLRKDIASVDVEKRDIYLFLRDRKADLVGEKKYLDAINKCERLCDKLKETNCPNSIKNYVRSVWTLLEINHLNLCLMTGSNDYKLSFIRELKTEKDYIEFMHVLAKYAGCARNFIVPQSQALQFFCYYKAADAGDEKAVRLLINKMLFCKVIRSDKEGLNLDCRLFYLPEALMLLSKLSRGELTGKKTAVSGYDDIIDRLMKLIKEPGASRRDELARWLMQNRHPEVKALTPMLFMEECFGRGDRKKASEYIKQLSATPALKDMSLYWLCRYHFASGEMDQQKNARWMMHLLSKSMASAFELFLDYCEGSESSKASLMPNLRRVYGLVNDIDFLVPRNLAYRLLTFAYELNSDDSLENNLELFTEINKVSVISNIFDHPNVLADNMFDIVKYYFTADNWGKSGSEEMLKTPREFEKMLGELAFSKDPMLGIFKHAHHSIIKTGGYLRKVDYNFENIDINSLYWLLVLNFLPREDKGFSDLAELFLKKTQDGLNSLKAFFHRSSMPVFLRKIYRYAAFSDESEKHPLFIPGNVSSFGLKYNDYLDAIKHLLEIKMLFCNYKQASECAMIIQYVSGYVLPVHHRVLKIPMSDESRIFLKLAVQESSLVNGIYQYNQISSLLKMIGLNKDLSFHIDVFYFLLDFVHRCGLDRDCVAGLFDGCLKIAGRVKEIIYGTIDAQCRMLSDWKESLLDPVKPGLDGCQLSVKTIEHIKNIKKVLFESDRVDFHDIDSAEILFSTLNQEVCWESAKASQQAGSASEEMKSITDFLPENKLLPVIFNSFIESYCLKPLRVIVSDEDFISMSKKLLESLSEESADNLILAEMFFSRFKELKLNCYQTAIVMASRIIAYFEKNKNIEFEMILIMLQVMRKVINLQQGGIKKSELQYYSLLAEMALRGEKVLAIFFDESENHFFSQVNVAISGDASLVKAALVKNSVDEGDIPRFIRTRHPGFNNSGLVQVAGTDAVPGQETSVLPADEYLKQADEYLKQMVMLDKTSKEYYFHSFLLAEHADHSLLLTLKQDTRLYLLNKPQQEVICLKLVELGRIKDALWVAEECKLGCLDTLLRWNFESDLLSSVEENSSPEKSKDKIPNQLVKEAEEGSNQAQCRLVDWVLYRRNNARKDKDIPHSSEPQEYATFRERLSEVQCCFYIHLPCIWSDWQRILYQGIALCTGIGGHQNIGKGEEKIKEALHGDADPVVPFILYWLQTSGLVSKEYFPNETLLKSVAARMPDSPGKLLTELVGNFEASAVQQLASDMNSVTGEDDIEKATLQERSRSIQEWFCQWQQQVRFEKMSPVERVIYHFDVAAENQWPVAKLPGLLEAVTGLGHSHQDIDILQNKLISSVKKLVRRSEAHKEFAFSLAEKISVQNRYRLLIKEGDRKRSQRKLEWDSPIFAQDNKLALFRAMPEPIQQKILLSMVAEIRHREQLPEHYVDKKKVNQDRMPGLLAKELSKEFKGKGTTLSSAALGKTIKAVAGQTGKKRHSFSELLQCFCSFDSAGLDANEKIRFREEIRRRAGDSLKDNIDFRTESEREVFSKITIYILTQASE